MGISRRVAALWGLCGLAEALDSPGRPDTGYPSTAGADREESPYRVCDLVYERQPDCYLRPGSRCRVRIAAVIVLAYTAGDIAPGGAMGMSR